MATQYAIERDLLVAALEEIGLDEDALRDDYSGRAMYGETCLGVVCEDGELLSFVLALADRGADTDWIPGVRSDGMGTSTIWYWPNVSVEDESD